MTFSFPRLFSLLLSESILLWIYFGDQVPNTAPLAIGLPPRQLCFTAIKLLWDSCFEWLGTDFGNSFGNNFA
jgi:hypothetical protein